VVCPVSCDGLAGESPVGVAAKRPRSWWPAGGETRSLKRHDKVAVGGEQVIGPYERNPVSASLVPPHQRDTYGCRAPRRWAKATNGVKILDRQHQRPVGVWGVERSYSPSWNRRDPSRHRQKRPEECPLRVLR
jgi:hypothetical protein